MRCNLALAALALLLGAASPEPLRRGDALIAAGDIDGAYRAYRDVAAARPAWPPAHLAMARAALIRGDAAGATNALDRAQALGVDPATLRTARGQVAVLAGDGAGALAAVAVVPSDFAADAAAVRADAARLLGDRVRAHRELATAQALAPGAPATLLAGARLALADGDPRRAQALVLATPDVRAALLAANLTRDLDGLAAALPRYDALLRRDPGNRDALAERAVTRGDAGANRAALADARALLTRDPGDAIGHYVQAALAARAGQWPIARTLLYRIKGSAAQWPAVILLKGAAAIAAGANEGAIALLRPLTLDQLGNVHAARLLAIALYRAGDRASVLPLLARFGDRGDRWSLAMIARCAEATGDRARAARVRDAEPPAVPPVLLARAQADAALAFTPVTAARLVRAAAAAGDLPQAAATRDRWRASYPADPAAIRITMRDAVVLNQWLPARALGGALATRGLAHDPLVLADLTTIAAGTGDRERALAALRAATAIAPHDPAVIAAAVLVRSSQRR